MSKLNELIQELCPDGVEHFPVKNCYKRLKGTPITAAQMKKIEDPNGEITVYAGGKTMITAKENNIANANITREPAVLVQSRGIINFIYCDTPFTFKNEMWAYTADDPITVKFLYFVLKNNSHYFNDIASKMGSMPQISLHVTEDFLIPFPPIEVQREIVSILDEFETLSTGLISKLNEELVARKKQYEYYRDSLLSPSTSKMIQEACPDGVEYLPVKCCYKRLKGTPVTAAQMKKIEDPNGDITVYAGGKTKVTARESAITNANITRKPAVLVQSRGIIDFIYCDKPFTFKSEMWAYTADNPITVKFLYYVFKSKTEYFNDIAKRMGSMPQISLHVTEDFLIPFLPIEVQFQIVQILNQLDTYYKNLTSNIKKEIAARQKQYEYYRDKLLTFKEKE